MKDEGMVEALRAQFTNPELGDNALPTKGGVQTMIDSAIAGIEQSQVNATVTAVAERAWWQWLLIGLLTLGVLLGVVGLIRSRKFVTESDLSAYAQASDVTNDLKKKADSDGLDKLESRVTATEERLEDTREQTGSRDVQIPEDTLMKVNNLKEDEEDDFFLIVDEQPYKFDQEGFE